VGCAFGLSAAPKCLLSRKGSHAALQRHYTRRHVDETDDGKKIMWNEFAGSNMNRLSFFYRMLLFNFLHLFHQDHWAMVILSPFEDIVDRRSYDDGYEDD
jgi:hypothetical protein